MLTGQITEVVLPSTSILRPALRKGQVQNQDQICEKQVLVIHGPENSVEKVTVIRGPGKCGGCLCATLMFNGNIQQTVNLADLSVVRYKNGTWNLDYWLGKF